MHETQRTQTNLPRVPQTKLNITSSRRQWLKLESCMQIAWDACLYTTVSSSHARCRRKSTWFGRTGRCDHSFILTWPADVLNLQVFVGGRARVAKDIVRRHHATLGLILAPRHRVEWRHTAIYAGHGTISMVWGNMDRHTACAKICRVIRTELNHLVKENIRIWSIT